jgi:hypothetical protein
MEKIKIQKLNYYQPIASPVVYAKELAKRYFDFLEGVKKENDSIIRINNDAEVLLIDCFNNVDYKFPKVFTTNEAYDTTNVVDSERDVEYQLEQAMKYRTFKLYWKSVFKKEYEDRIKIFMGHTAICELAMLDFNIIADSNQKHPVSKLRKYEQEVYDYDNKLVIPDSALGKAMNHSYSTVDLDVIPKGHENIIKLYKGFTSNKVREPLNYDKEPYYKEKDKGYSENEIIGFYLPTIKSYFILDDIFNTDSEKLISDFYNKILKHSF